MHSIFNIFSGFVLLQGVFGDFLPISIHYDGASLEARDEQKRDCFKPTQHLDLHYIEEYSAREPYLISVTPFHPQPIYVLTEKFEHFLSDVTCITNANDDTAEIIYTFDTAESMQWAKAAWGQNRLLFVTHQVSCNEAYERAVYKAKSIHYDAKNLIVVVTGHFLPLGDTVEAHTHLTFSGGPVTQELKHKLRRRSNLQYDMVKRDKSSTSWHIPLDQNWDTREEIVTLQEFGLACVNCSLTGEATVSFTFDVELGDLLRFDSPFNEATIKLEATKAIDGDFNIEVTVAAVAHAQCDFPGGCSGSVYSTIGKNFQSSAPKGGPGFKIGGWDLSASLSLGLSVSLDAEAKMKMTVPVTIGTPQGSSAWKNFFDGGGNTLDLKPNFKTPILNREDAEAKVCAAVAIGPSASLTLKHTDFPEGELTIGARLDLPRVSLCAALAQDVNSDCDIGDFDEAIKLTGDVGVGLTIFGRANLGIIKLGSFNKNVDGLSKIWNILEHCYDISGGDDNNPTPPIDQPPPVSGNVTNNPPPTNGNNNLTIPGGYENGTYDCSSVAPSPGGQPCGDVTMLCPSAYAWSCGNGEEGVVPPGTFCACGAFRYPGWLPPTASNPTCTEGITCVTETSFSVCSPAGIEPPQPVAPGTVCRNGVILAARRYSRM